ncbi:hypothetical protein H4R18_003321 [Coemansia javaensis]|uniref:COPI associated n=1 Tax=Coemansia javaensis TaxID=2761396 RepID=A0A9W8H9H9_9FUNG|nr:hypothetical protein H4R18_003321 [Coemansia javaensis]
MGAGYFRGLAERLRRPGGPPLYFRAANVVVAALMVASGIVFFTWAGFERIMLGVYLVLFGAWIVGSEVSEATRMARYARFMLTWLGRGLFYVFIGCLVLGDRAAGWALGALIIAAGVVYVVLGLTVMRNKQYGPSSPASSHTRPGDAMYDPNSVYGRKYDMYGSAVSVHQHGLGHQQQHQQQKQPQYTTSHYVSSDFARSQAGLGQYSPDSQHNDPTDPTKRPID